MTIYFILKYLYYGDNYFIVMIRRKICRFVDKTRKTEIRSLTLELRAGLNDGTATLRSPCGFSLARIKMKESCNQKGSSSSETLITRPISKSIVPVRRVRCVPYLPDIYVRTSFTHIGTCPHYYEVCLFVKLCLYKENS